MGSKAVVVVCGIVVVLIVATVLFTGDGRGSGPKSKRARRNRYVPSEAAEVPPTTGAPPVTAAPTAAATTAAPPPEQTATTAQPPTPGSVAPAPSEAGATNGDGASPTTVAPTAPPTTTTVAPTTTPAPPPETALPNGRRNRFLMLTGLPEGFRLHSKERNFGVWGAASVLVYSALHNDTDGMVFDSRKYRHPKGEHWWRIPVLREYLPQYEWAMWVDADTIVNDFAIDLDELVRSVSDETILIVRVVHIPGISDDLNNGVFMIRNHPEAFELLRDWDTMPNSNGGYFDQSDLITILNYDKRLAKSHRKAPKGDRFWKRTKFQDRSGLLLQHYSAKCNDYRPGERAFISHYPGACTPDWTWARTEFCKAFSRTAVMRAEIARNPRAHGSVSPQEVAGVAWAVEQCTNREELDDLRNRVNALERTR